jgi:hypothetical protein
MAAESGTVDKLERSALRKHATRKIFGEENFNGIEIKAAHRFEHQESWPNSSAICQKIIVCKYPRLATDPKQRAKARQTAQIIFLYWRLGWSAYEIGRNMRLKTPAVELRIRRIVALARRLIMDNNLKSPSGESFFAAKPKARRGRVLVSSFKVVTSYPGDLHWLVTLSDIAIREQALKALTELETQENEIQDVYEDFSLLKAA